MPKRNGALEMAARDINLDGCVQLGDLLDLLGALWNGDCQHGGIALACPTRRRHASMTSVHRSCNEGFADYNGVDADGCEGEVLPASSCGDDVVFDNHAYATVQINGQCWFAENLQSTSYANGDAISGSSMTRVGRRPRMGLAQRLGKGPASVTVRRQVGTLAMKRSPYLLTAGSTTGMP